MCPNLNVQIGITDSYFESVIRIRLILFEFCQIKVNFLAKVNINFFTNVHLKKDFQFYDNCKIINVSK